MGGLLSTATDDDKHKQLHQQLIHAVSMNDTETIQELLRVGVALDRKDNNGMTALMWSAMVYPHLKVVEALVRAGAALDLQEDETGMTALMQAAAGGRTEIVQELVQAGAALDLQDAWETTAIMWAAKNGHMDVVTVLRRAMDNLDACRTNSSTVNQCGGTCYLAAPLILAVKSLKLFDALQGYRPLYDYLAELRRDSLEQKCVLGRGTCKDMTRVARLYDTFIARAREFAADGGYEDCTLQAFLSAAGCDWVHTEMTSRLSFETNPFESNVWWLQCFNMEPFKISVQQNLGKQLQLIVSDAPIGVVGGFVTYHQRRSGHVVAFTLCGTGPSRTLHVCNWGACGTFKRESEPILLSDGKTPLLYNNTDEEQTVGHITLVHVPPRAQRRRRPGRTVRYGYASREEFAEVIRRGVHSLTAKQLPIWYKYAFSSQKNVVRYREGIWTSARMYTERSENVTLETLENTNRTNLQRRNTTKRKETASATSAAAGKKGKFRHSNR